MAMMLMGALSNSIFIISWTPKIEESYTMYLVIATFAFTNCLATSQVRGVFGIYFPDNPSAYSAAIIFETIGLVLGSILSIYFCTRIKIYVYMAIIVLGLVSYNYLEVRKNILKNNETESSSDTDNRKKNLN
jgi:hypothetical protein